MLPQLKHILKMKQYLCLATIILWIYACNSPKNVVGTYNYSYKTEAFGFMPNSYIRLDSNNTFTYFCAGFDLFGETCIVGNYIIKNDSIEFIPKNTFNISVKSYNDTTLSKRKYNFIFHTDDFPQKSYLQIYINSWWYIRTEGFRSDTIPVMTPKPNYIDSFYLGYGKYRSIHYQNPHHNTFIIKYIDSLGFMDLMNNNVYGTSHIKNMKIKKNKLYLSKKGFYLRSNL